MRIPVFIVGCLCFAGTFAGAFQGIARADEVRGTIRGRVLYDGPVRPPPRLEIEANREVCGAKVPILAESLVVGEGSSLANTAVMLAGVIERDPKKSDGQLNQENCVFLPHVQTVTEGSSIVISNSDKIIHNVHARSGGTTLFNLGMPLRGVKVKRTVPSPGVVKLSCDSGHTWMEAYIVVVPSSYHATSNLAGEFAIERVAPGSYTLRSWHETLGVLDTPVVVKAGEDTIVTITYRARTVAKAGVPALDFASAVIEPPPSEEARVDENVVSLAERAAAALALKKAELGMRQAARTANVAAGRALYFRYCAACHGDLGDGRGEARRSLRSKPRDFTRGEFKFRTTKTGQPPTEDDVYRTISVGAPGTDMPAWKDILNREERRTLARFVMTFAERFVTGAPPGDTLEIPAETKLDPASVARGKELYQKLQCAQCHGVDGRASGVAKKLFDDWGDPILAADLTRGVFKGGPRPEDTYRTLATGLSGTPMPSFAEMIGPDEIWDVVHYVESLAESSPLRTILGVP